MLQNGTGYMDGVPGFTQVSYVSRSFDKLILQCPIAPGANFTYRFTVDNQYGTYW